jgi:hypothetical protein
MEGVLSLISSPGILLGVSAIILSIIAIENSRRNSRAVMTRIVEVKNEVDLKAQLRRLATIVGGMADSVDRNLDPKMFSFPPLDSMTDEVIRHIHDKGERESILRAEAVSIRVSFADIVGKEESLKIETEQQFEKFLKGSRSIESALANFRFSPSCVSHDSIDLAEYIEATKAIYGALDELSQQRDLLGSFDHSVLDWLAEEIVLPIVRTPIRHLTSSHEIKLRWLDKSGDIRRKLLIELCGYETIENIITDRKDLALERLQRLQRSILIEAK